MYLIETKHADLCLVTGAQKLSLAVKTYTVGKNLSMFKVLVSSSVCFFVALVNAHLFFLTFVELSY